MTLRNLWSAIWSLFRREASAPRALPVTVHPRDSDQPWYEDYGQHDIPKRDMRLALWRFTYGAAAPGMIDFRDPGLVPDDVAEIRYVGALFPLTPDLCAACRRIGFERLVAGVSSDLAITSDDVDRFYRLHRSTVTGEYSAVVQRCKDATHRMGREILPPPWEEFTAIYDLGPRQGFDRVLRAPAVPLTPFPSKE